MMGVFVQINHDTMSRLSRPVGYVITESGCWDWVGFINNGGYGQFNRNGRHVYAHRWMYEQAKGSIPRGLQIDHLCRNRACCNPDHLEAALPRTNVLRGASPAAQNAKKTHCHRGHLLSADNLVRSVTLRGERNCRTCHRANAARQAIREREEREAAQ